MDFKQIITVARAQLESHRDIASCISHLYTVDCIDHSFLPRAYIHYIYLVLYQSYRFALIDKITKVVKKKKVFTLVCTRAIFTDKQRRSGRCEQRCEKEMRENFVLPPGSEVTRDTDMVTDLHHELALSRGWM